MILMLTKLLNLVQRQRDLIDHGSAEKYQIFHLALTGQIDPSFTFVDDGEAMKRIRPPVPV